jgi:hypothetical protein
MGVGDTLAVYGSFRQLSDSTIVMVQPRAGYRPHPRQGFAFDQWEVPKALRTTRYERYLTDPKIRALMSKWEVEVAVKLVDDQPR